MDVHAVTLNIHMAFIAHIVIVTVCAYVCLHRKLCMMIENEKAIKRLWFLFRIMHISEICLHTLCVKEDLLNC